MQTCPSILGGLDPFGGTKLLVAQSMNFFTVPLVTWLEESAVMHDRQVLGNGIQQFDSNL